MSLSVVVLAAGQGTRMCSNVPKVLHCIAGQSILGRIISTLRLLAPERLVIVHGHQGEKLKDAFSEQTDILWAYQENQLGTGHAAKQALPLVGNVDRILILYGDVPLISSETLSKLLKTVPSHAMGLITWEAENPTGYGRIIRDEKGKVIGIVEEKDASDAEKKIKECNPGFFVVPKSLLEPWLSKLKPQNQQNEYYLTDILKFAIEEGITITTIFPKQNWEVLGVNDKIQLAELERAFQRDQAISLMKQGVTIRDPNRLDIRGSVKTGFDVEIDVNVLLEGNVTLGDQVKIGPNVCIKNAVIQAGTTLLANCVIENAVIGANCSVGPFARIRPGADLANNVKIGNFVEIKNSQVGSNSKINHLSYVGDASIGSDVNIGAGTITCNFDGIRKHKTTIGNGVFIGSNTQLIAPITIGEGSTIGAGTTVVKDVPANHLIHNQITHRSVANWAKTEKELE